MKFYDVKAKKSFETNKYRTVKKKVKGKLRTFAVAEAPSGIEAWRIM